MDKRSLLWLLGAVAYGAGFGTAGVALHDSGNRRGAAPEAAVAISKTTSTSGDERSSPSAGRLRSSTSPPTERLSLDSRPPAESPAQPTEVLGRPCDDPALAEELVKQLDVLDRWIRKALECGYTSDDCIPAPLRDSVRFSTAELLFAEEPENWPDRIYEELYGIASVMNTRILDRVIASGIAPVYDGYTLPETYYGNDGTQVFFNSGSDGNSVPFLLNQIRGHLSVWRLPADWIEPSMIWELRTAADAISDL